MRRSWKPLFMNHHYRMINICSRFLTRSSRHRCSTRWVFLWLLTLLGGLNLASSLQAAPVNDNFASATLISGSSATVAGSNVGATKELGEPPIAGNAGGASVWWFWTASASGSVTVSTLGSSFDTVLGIFSGSPVTALTSIAANDDSPSGGTLTSKVTFNAVAGTRYAIGVDGFNGIAGNITLSVSGPSSSLSCTYSLSASSASFSASGGAATLSVTTGTGCGWTATSGASWITITAGASGSGSGTVSYS